MSRYRRILVHLSDSVRAESLLAFAARLAAEHGPSCRRCMQSTRSPSVPT